MSIDSGAVPVVGEPGASGSGPPVAEEGRPLRDVVCILGQTGAGKSKLAVELALAVDGEVVNCDAMQVYKGLPIATAQIPEQEQRVSPTTCSASSTPRPREGRTPKTPASLCGSFETWRFPL